MELKEIRERLDIIEKIEAQPSIIFTDLYNNKQKNNFLFNQIKIKGQTLSNYILDKLRKNPIFFGTHIDYINGVIRVYTISLNEQSIDVPMNDLILEIDLCDKTYQKHYKTLKYYEDVINQNIWYEEKELPSIYKKYDNLTLKKRIENAKEALKSKKKVSTKIADTIFALSVKKSYAIEVVQKAKNELKENNESRKKSYIRSLERQSFYKENFDKHKNMIIEKQNFIINHLLKLGYVETK